VGVGPVEFLIFLAILAAVVAFVTRPLLRPAGSAPRQAASRHAGQLADLEAAREAKYREIRDAELDYRTGKLSTPDYQAVDRSLRAEAIEILRELDRVRGGSRNGGEHARPSDTSA
jgi:hypothetical protein